MPDGLRFTFHGVRGSVAIDRPDSARYGGSTICISARLSEDHYLVLDAGTGLRDLQHHIPAEAAMHYTFLVTHFHWDHLLGLPFFRPLYQPQSEFTFYATPVEGSTVEAGIAGVMEPPLFPVPLRLGTVRTHLHRRPRRASGRWDRLTVRSARLNHPQGVNAYRIDHGDRSLVLATDVEAGDPESDDKLIALARGADVLIHDAAVPARRRSRPTRAGATPPGSRRSRSPSEPGSSGSSSSATTRNGPTRASTRSRPPPGSASPTPTPPTPAWSSSSRYCLPPGGWLTLPGDGRIENCCRRSSSSRGIAAAALARLAVKVRGASTFPAVTR